MTARMGATVRAAATALAGLVLAHNLIFLAGYGARFGQALAHTGHNDAWTLAVIVSLTLGSAILAAALWRVRGLRREALNAGANRLPTEPDAHAFLRRWLGWWIALALTIAVLFVVQENMELARIDRPMPGIGILASAAYPHSIAIIAAVALVVSLVAALLGWKIEILMARLRALTSTSPRTAVSAIPPDDMIERRRGSILGRRLAGRAPPLEFAP